MRCPRVLAASPVLFIMMLTLCVPNSRGQATMSSVKLEDPRADKTLLMGTDAAAFGWKMFAFLNWPELPGQRGIPDSGKSIGDHGATVWESYKNVSEVYLANGKRPAPWETNDEIPTASGKMTHPSAKQLAAFGPVDSTWVHYLAEPVMIDGQQICDSSSNVVRYDVRGNRSYFDYVVNNTAGYELFNVEGQEAALADSNFTFQFATDALEVKASWRILSAGQDGSRYWTAIGVYRDKNRVLHTARIGLTGLHIISKALPNWVWITFEQVDNATATYKYFLGNKGAAVGQNINYNSALDPVNKEWQGALAGTKWQYYALMATQTQFVDATQKVILMANTQMETYFQPNSSCISCHKIASVGPRKNLRLLLFYPLNPYTGAVNFQAVANQQFPGQTFKDLDFAWSLRNAQYKSISAKPVK